MPTETLTRQAIAPPVNYALDADMGSSPANFGPLPFDRLAIAPVRYPMEVTDLRSAVASPASVPPSAHAIDTSLTVWHELAQLPGSDLAHDGLLGIVSQMTTRGVWDDDLPTDDVAELEASFDAPGLTPAVVDGFFGQT